MSNASDSDDDPPTNSYNPSQHNAAYNININNQRSRLSDSADSSDDERHSTPVKRFRSSTNEYSADEDVQIPAKRSRSNTLGASSQSSSGAEYASTSDHQSDTEAPPSFGSYQQFSTAAPPKNKPRVGGIGERMLKNAGYVEGTGLGKHGQGRVDPIEASTQRGRTGLGFQAYSKGKGYEGVGYHPSMEVISAEEKVIWMKPSKDEKLDRDLLETWMRLGPRKMTIDDELEFCDETILQDVLSLKTALDDMTAEDLRRVRSMCNPFEKIGSAFFINRAALKMANMDSVFDYMFTEPRDGNGRPMVGNNELLYFADVCAGPGGFTEYVLWRKKWMAKGFGFTLKSQNDFKLGDLHACSTETFTPYYGINEDGDVFNPQNLESLKKFVLENTNDKGVHFMMADGGFSVEGQENIQEILSKQLYLCQCLAALSIVRTGGNFVVKLFDVFTEFSAGLVYLMYRSFDRISIHKPNTSRPANSERYLICKGKRESCDTIERHLAYVNTILWQYTKKEDVDVTHLVPLDLMKADRHFYKHICDSNNRIGTLQKVSLLKVIEYHRNPKKFEETRHAEMRTACLKLWKIPDKPKTNQHPCGDIEAFRSVLNIINTIPNVNYNERSFKDILKFKPKVYRTQGDLPNPKARFAHNLDWKFIYLSNHSDETTDNKFSFYLGSAGCNVYELIGNSWRINYNIKLPADTLVLAERVQENYREGNAMNRHNGIHIIDAVVLGGVCVLHKPLQERYNRIMLFCMAHNIPKSLKTDSTRIPLRCKKLYDFKNLDKELRHLVKRQVKKIGLVNTTNVPNLFDNSDLYYVTKSILFIKVTKDPWVKVLSKTHERHYYFNTAANKSSFDCPMESVMNVFDTLKNYAEWPNIQDEDSYKRDALYKGLLHCAGN